ncbi:MAG: hypothetical protein ABSG92_02750 [Conexivisphaerales archaeon]
MKRDMRKLNLRKDLRFYNSFPRHVEFIQVPFMKFIMIDGKGDPNTSKAYLDAIKEPVSVVALP